MLNINNGGLDGGSGKLVDDENGSTSFRYWIRHVMLHLATNGDDEEAVELDDEFVVVEVAVVVEFMDDIMVVGDEDKDDDEEDESIEDGLEGIDGLLD